MSPDVLYDSETVPHGLRNSLSFYLHQKISYLSVEFVRPNLA